MVAKAHMHLAQFLTHGPSYHSLGMWRHPKTASAGFDWRQPDLYQHIAQTCERGLFDMVFFADLNYIRHLHRHAGSGAAICRTGARTRSDATAAVARCGD